ncbi:MAG: branched-chain amino acid ABC transporter permease [Dehalococcoidia bacterium]|nr:branched-chain amino acid ABC transporter permease [Dehalococcoidia bacterium]
MPSIDVSTLLFLLSDGLLWGFTIALVALGLSLIFGVMGIVNMAHGDIYMVGAVLALYVLEWTGNFWLSIIIVPVVIGLLCVPTERFVLRPFEGRPAVTMIATVGIAYIIQQVVLATFGGMHEKMPNPWPVVINLFDVGYSGYRVLIAVISVVIIIGLWFFLYKTSYGILIRASIQDKEMANAMGINSNKIAMATFALGGALAAIGGVLAAPVTQVFYLMGADVILLCFIIVIVGGLGSLKGTLIAALMFCTLQGGMSIILTPVEAKVAIFVIMILVLLFRPRGMFAK